MSELTADKDERLAQLLVAAATMALNIALGMELDDQDRPKPGAESRVIAIEISGDGVELLRMSHRPSTTKGDGRRQRTAAGPLGQRSPVFRQVLKAIVKSATTSSEMRPEDFDGANEAIANLLPELLIRVEQFFPAAVEFPQADGAELSTMNMLVRSE